MRSTQADESISLKSAVLSAHQRSILALLIEPSHYAVQAGVRFDSVDALVEDYISCGWLKGFDPAATFQAARYLNVVPGLGEAGQNPFLHYLFDVIGEGNLARALDGLSAVEVGGMRVHFDADWYLRENPDVEMSGTDPFIHYLTFGWRERRDPSPHFATGSYLDLYSDVRDAGINPFWHWLSYGIREGRSSGKSSFSALASWESLSVGQQAILDRMFLLAYYRMHVGAGGDPEGPVAKRVVSNSDWADFATPSFSASRYIAAHPEVRDNGQVPFLHYLFCSVGEDAVRELFVAQSPAVLEAVCDHFDAAWYLYSYPDIEATGQDALIHYMTLGWREHRDPSQEFSTKAYLLRYPDIVEAGVNPFLHWVAFGKKEGRSGASSANNFRSRPYAPSVTAVLVNGVDNPLSPESISAVTHQSYSDLSIIVVGGRLSDACLAALNTGAHGTGPATPCYTTTDISAAPWDALERAVLDAQSDLLWFVQGRAVHDSAFLSRLTSSFADGSVQLGLGRSLEPDDADYAIAEDELERRMEGWTRHPTTPAPLWFADQMRPGLLSADQHSFLWRRRTLDESIWRRASDYRYLGLRYLHLHMASGGQVATVRDALIRIPPDAGASARLRDDNCLHVEEDRLCAEVQSFWSVPGLPSKAAVPIPRSKHHVLIVTHGIFAGGAENLPIQLANSLTERGIVVSLLIFKIELNAQMRATLNPGVSIYEADWVMEYGCDQFLRDIGCSLIHSHGVIGEMFFFRFSENGLPVPYIATLHGSYEASTSAELPERFIAKIVRSVDLFVYTADKNLGPLLRHDVRPERLIKMINAMPVDEVPCPWSRAELGIAEDALVFTLVARGIPEKGWSTAINAFKAVQKRNPRRSIHLFLIGEGEEPERLKPLYIDDGSISFLGFQLRIHGIYRMTDVAIVPTRFAGESFPLCMIQALQVGVPVIATNVGEIASMLEEEGVVAGLVIETSSIDAEFDARFADAMQSLVDDELRRRLSDGAAFLGRRYDMTAFTDQYITVYEDVIRRFAVSRAVLPEERVEQDALDAV